MSLNKKKIIRDATITPGGVLSGEVGYGNNFERIVGTYVPLVKNLRSKVINLSTAERYESLLAEQKVMSVDYEKGYYFMGSYNSSYFNLRSGIVFDSSDIKKICGYRLNDYPILLVSFSHETDIAAGVNSTIFIEKKLVNGNSSGTLTLPGIGFQTLFYKDGMEIFVTDTSSKGVIEIFYEPKDGM